MLNKVCMSENMKCPRIKKSKCHKAKKAQKLYEKKEKMSTTFKVKKKM